MVLTRFSKRLMVSIFACYCFLPLTAVAQMIDFSGVEEIDFSGDEFHEPVDAEYWMHHPQDGIEVLPHAFGKEVMFRHPISFKSVRFYSTASFKYANFESVADFSNAQFYSAADFDLAQFDSTVVFYFAQFNSEVRFLGAKFNFEADFFEAQFDSAAIFNDAQFESTAFFRDTEFYSLADFNFAQFHSVVNFSYAQFDSTVDFIEAQFHSKANFGWAEFHFTADFRYAEFHSTADFRYAEFDSEANFRKAKFKGKVSFKNATLPHNLDFREVIDIAKEIDFTYARPPGENNKCGIALSGTDIGKIKINMRIFELWFPADTTFKDSIAGKDTIKVIGEIDSSSYDEKISVYVSVLKKLKDDGLMDSYRILDIDYREFKYRHDGGLNWYVANTFHRFWWNYGYAKELIFLWTIGFLFLFSVLNINFYRRLSENVYAIPFLGKRDYDSMRWPKSWLYYWLQVVTYTAIIFFGLKMDIAKFKQGVVRSHPFLFVYLMFIYVLGLVCMGFIANIIFTR